MENLRVEYKARLTPEVLDGFAGDIAAFANAKGGEIWFGVDDRGRPTGADLTEVDRQGIAQKAARCRPPARIDFEQREYEGQRITVVIIPASTSIHADERQRFPIRIGGIKDYLDATGILLLAREKNLEFASAGVGVGWAPAGPRAAPQEMVDGVVDYFVAGLESDNPVVRAEILKDLESAAYRYRLESSPRIMEVLIALSERLSDSEEGRPLDLLRYILLQASVEDQARWVPDVREKALALSHAGVSGFAVQQAMSFLGEFSEPEDTDDIVVAISTWPKDLYGHARPSAWLQGLKSKGYLFEIQQALVKRLAKTADPEIIERIKECLEQLRRN